MANPAEQSARDDAERHGTIVGSDVDRIDQGCRDDLAADDTDHHDEWCFVACPHGTPHGAWLHGESPTLWGTDEGGE